MTPQLQQSIRLLQLSTLELQQEIEQTLADNPLLELAEDWLDGATPISADSELEGAGSGAADGEAADADAANGADLSTANGSAADEFFNPAADHAPVSSAPDDSYESSRSSSMEAASDGEADAPIDTDSGSDWTLEDFVRRPLSDDDDETPTQLQAASVTLREHLLGQLRMLNLSDRDRGLLAFLVESLDENGYLDVSLEGVLAELPGELEVELRGAGDRAVDAAILRPARRGRAQRRRMPGLATGADGGASVLPAGAGDRAPPSGTASRARFQPPAPRAAGGRRRDQDCA